MSEALALTLCDFAAAVMHAAWFTLAVFIGWFAWASWDLSHTDAEKREALAGWLRGYPPRHMKEDQ